MLRNLPIEDANSNESEQDNNSTTEHFLMAFRKMMKKEMEVMVIRTVQKVIGPIVEDLIRKVVKEEIQLAQEKFLTHQNQNSVDEATASRTLELKFLDEVSDLVLTGKEIKGKEGSDIKISLHDNVNGLPIISGPEASAKVEILVLEAGPNDNISNVSRKDFNNSIIRENDKAKPHFPKPVYVYLEKGIGVLSNVRLGHDSRWTKGCKCRLGARVVDAFDGSIVKEARTKSFMVQDSRCKYNEKHYPPKLSDYVWRLDHIGKDGEPCKRLHKAEINTVQEFLFLLNIDPQRLQKMVRAGDKTWNTTVDHARQCILDDTRIYFYSSSIEYKTGVVFDIVGQLKGLLHNHHFVPIGSVSESEKEEARKLLASAFENRKDINSLDEISFWYQFPPCISSATNSSQMDGPDRNCIIDGVIDGYDPTQSQGIGPSFDHTYGSSRFGSLSSNGNTEDAQELVPVSWSFSDFDSVWGNFGDDEPILSLFISDNDEGPEFQSVESHSGQQTTAASMRFIGLVMTLRWLFRVRKRVASLTHSRVQKRQRQC